MQNKEAKPHATKNQSSDGRLDAYRRKLMEASSIDDCEKIPAYEPDGQHNYLFVSYAHKDYKQVYCDIANLYFSGVRVWYDEGLSAGKNWQEEVKKHLEDPCCSGVIFYLSENLFVSQSILYEIQLVDRKKPYFAVNLRDQQPSQILKSCISQIDSPIDAMDWVHRLSGAFKDSVTYLSYSSASHDDKLLQQVRKQFNVTVEPANAQPKPNSALAAELLPSSVKSQTFLISDGVLQKYLGEDAEAVVPNTVTAIGDHAFENCCGLKAIHIPENVASIGQYAFANCCGLALVRIPGTLSAIGSYAFSGCSALQDVCLPDSMAHIGDHAFEGCSGLKAISVPNGLTRIEEGMFAGCEALEGIILPKGIAEIGSHAFDRCERLKGIGIPDTVKKVGDYAFVGCANLAGIVFPGPVEQMGKGAFLGCASLRYVEMPGAGLTELEDGTFCDCKALTQVEIRNGITSVGRAAFKGCYELKAVALPDSVTCIGELAFANCCQMHSIRLSSGITSIGRGAFAECGMLFEINLPQGITEICDDTFVGCGRLTNIQLPDGVTAIGEMAFGDCGELAEVVIPESVTSIAGSAFRGSRGVRIRTAKGSFAQKYAKRHWLRVECF